MKQLLILCLLTSLCLSCSKEDVLPNVCTSGCEAYVELGYPMDSNGFYHVKLDFSGEYLPRFAVDAYATATDSYYWYNETPIVEAVFTGDKEVKVLLPGLNFKETIPVVQETTLYFSGKSDKLYTRRIVGPITPGLVGDTLNINMEVYWDAGNQFDLKNIPIKIILE